MTLTVAETFAGAGGMALGFQAAGYRTVWAGEADRHACATFRAAFPGVPLFEGRITGDEDCGLEPGELDVLAGGPPCQPFSSAGQHLGEYDPRDGFPIAIRLVARWRPRAFVFENVAGLTSSAHRAYLDRVVADLSACGYAVVWRVLDAAAFGVPQRRKRVFLVGFRDSGAASRFAWPEPAHSFAALVEAKWVSGSYWREHGIAPASEPSKAEARVLADLRVRHRDLFARPLARWRTVRDAIGDLLDAPAIRTEALGAVSQGVDQPGFAISSVGNQYTSPAPGLTRRARDYLARDLGAGDGLAESLQPIQDAPYASTQQTDATEILRTLPDQDGAEDRDGWQSGSTLPLSPEEVLQSTMHGCGIYWAARRGDERTYESTARSGGLPGGAMHKVRTAPIRCSSQRREPVEQRFDEPASAVQVVPYDGAPQECALQSAGMRTSDIHEEGLRGQRIVRDALPAMAAVGRSAAHQGESAYAVRAPSGSDKTRTHLRRLSPVETARLQAFPDEHPFAGPKTAVYRQVGNACPPPLAEVVARAVVDALDEVRR